MERRPKRINQVRRALAERIGGSSGSIQVVRAPLRVCPVGAHIDHQDGIVTGLTLDEAVLFAFAPRTDGTVRLWSADFPGEMRFDLAPEIATQGDWGDHARGAAAVLTQERGIVRGLDGYVLGALPIGGLSSSAAVNVAYLLALGAVNGLEEAIETTIERCRRIDHEFIGLNNGLLDQSIILGAKRDHLTVLDCRTRAFTHIPTPQGMRFDILIAHSGLTRSLVETDYNNRVAECREAARLLLEAGGHPVPEEPKLRDMLEASGDMKWAVINASTETDTWVKPLPEVLARRATHFFKEVGRVDDFDRYWGLAGKWGATSLQHCGGLMTRSGTSSIHKYECGSPHLTKLWKTLRGAKGVYGTRFSGAGFKGACVALSNATAREAIVAHVAEKYPAAHPDIAEKYSLHFCKPGGPAEVL